MKDLELKIKIIELLIEADEKELLYPTRTFVRDTGADVKQVRIILKELKSNGMVDSNYGIDEDGLLCGRGYFLTPRATQWSIREWLQELKKLQSK